VEQVVRRGGVDRDPGVAPLRQHRGRRHQEGLVRGGQHRQTGGEREHAPLHRLHGGIPPHGFRSKRIAPSSCSPCAERCCGACGGHSNGMLTSSCPPTSRAASTTSLYLPAARPASGALSLEKSSRCWPAGRVAPLTPSIGSA